MIEFILPLTNLEFLSMCGRFTLGKKTEQIKDYFESHFNFNSCIATLDKYALKFNIAPSSNILCLRYNNENAIECHPLRWGLVPSWSKGIDNRFNLNNARADSVTTKPSFRGPFKQQRCLIISDGFYEWQAQTSGKQPYYISRKDSGIFTFAGVWDHWISPDQSNSIQSCSIITTEANSFMAKIHSRMPVIIDKQFQYDWLSPKQSTSHSDKMVSLLTQSDYSEMHYHAVSKTVNSTSNDSHDLITKLK